MVCDHLHIRFWAVVFAFAIVCRRKKRVSKRAGLTDSFIHFCQLLSTSPLVAAAVHPPSRRLTPPPRSCHHKRFSMLLMHDSEQHKSHYTCITHALLGERLQCCYNRVAHARGAHRLGRGRGGRSRCIALPADVARAVPRSQCRINSLLNGVGLLLQP